ncbi:hypothetical protein HBH98_042980 [Parastagonospora nodorum]|nr:hypothetical protein HBH52_054970 [Parastagonospora nodorum]KAH4039227.1 hypothetical protein HBI09_045550 [Parastagonospora nodorum]KAH4131264.1 hypothetical protein HBH47_018370 [Parastagonospora nodorum]KAH4195033.1 hypothetical protein HBH42_088100 [Parastagonospora nodorum]KAH4231995.1 hypothetical protein HBI06_077400 [Parastagonospora nodorum]
MDHSTRHQKPLPQPHTLDEDMIEFAWSERALLWIQLYHDLLFAAASTPAGPTVVVVDTVAFRDFTDALENEPTAVSDITRDRNEFKEKKNHMVSAKRSAIKALSNRNNAEDDPLLITHVRITPDMLDRYGALRGDSKPEEDITQPDQDAELWKFLNHSVLEEYPKLYSMPSASQRLAKAELVPTYSIRDQETKSSKSCSELRLSVAIKTADFVTEATVRPGGGHVNLERASTAGMEEPSAHEALEAEVLEDPSTPEIVTAAKRAREATLETLPDFSVDRDDSPRKRAKLTDATNDSETEPEATPKQKYRWTEKEVNCIYRCINEYCKVKGVDVYARKEVVTACVDALGKDCAKEHPKKTPSGRSRQEVDSKIMNLERFAKKSVGVTTVQTLVAKAAAVKKQVASGEEVSKEDRYPSEYLSLWLSQPLKLTLYTPRTSRKPRSDVNVN